MTFFRQDMIFGTRSWFKTGRKIDRLRRHHKDKKLVSSDTVQQEIFARPEKNLWLEITSMFNSLIIRVIRRKKWKRMYPKSKLWSASQLIEKPLKNQDMEGFASLGLHSILKYWVLSWFVLLCGQCTLYMRIYENIYQDIDLDLHTILDLHSS